MFDKNDNSGLCVRVNRVRMRFVYTTVKTLFAATALTSTDVCLDKVVSNYRVQNPTHLYSIAKSNRKYKSKLELT